MRVRFRVGVSLAAYRRIFTNFVAVTLDSLWQLPQRFLIRHFSKYPMATTAPRLVLSSRL
jgi:hypothetical protein